LLVAGVLAVGTGGLTFNYLSSLGHVQSGPVTVATRSVVIAAREIPPHTTISPDMLGIASRPVNAVDPDAYGDLTHAVGRTTAVDIPAGATLTVAKTASGSGDLTDRVPRGMRAVAVAIDRVKGVAGLIAPGDHVDVIAALPARAGSAPAVATILRDVPVLAIGTALDATHATSVQQDAAPTATLAVTPSQAKTLTLVDLSATIRLTLRGPGDDRRRPLSGETLDLSVPAPRVAVAPAAAPAAVTAAVRPASAQEARPAAPPHSGIQVIAGDRIVQ
jgi:pilus assembly protein CpaB